MDDGDLTRLGRTLGGQDKYQTWDPALLGALRAVHHRRRAVLTALLAVALGVGLLPGVGRADYGPPGLNAARIDLSDDGYSGSFNDGGGTALVTGKGFSPDDVAQIFECPEKAGDLHADCLVIGAAQTDGDGMFGPTSVRMHSFFSTASAPASTTSGSGVNCYGENLPGVVQCSVVAATYVATTQEPTARAEHYICFDAPGACKPKPPNDIPTTTTTNPPPAPEWEPGAAMNVARQNLATATAADGRIYALGGNEGTRDATNSAETMNPCSGRTWSSLPPMPTARTQFAAAAGPDGRIYAIGGRESSVSGTPLGTVDAYDPVTNTWSRVASLAIPRSNLAAATGPDGRIYAIGGMVGGGSVTFAGAAVPTVEAYDTVTNSWAVVTPLSTPRRDHGAALGPDGRIYAIGGSGLTGTPIPRLESYAPGPGGTPGTWMPVTWSDFVPPQIAVTTGPDGLIYGTGGTDGNVTLRTISTYDTATGTWTTSMEAMTSNRAGHGAATGKDGRIYAIGGSDDGYWPDDPVGTDAGPLSSVESVKLGPNTCPRLLPPADFDGDGDTDISVFRPSTGTWFAKDGATSAWGAQGDIPVPGDYDGDRKVDVAVFRPATGLWAILHSGGGPDTFVTYGIATDVPVPADYDGDGRTDIAVYRPDYATWWVHRSSDGTDTARTFGLSTDVPVPGDYDGDAKADLGIFRDGTWFVQPASGGAYTATTYGIGGDIPVPGDYDADQRSDMAIFRPSDGTWALHHSGDGTDEIFGFGIGGDVPVPGDYNGDRITDPAVFRTSTAQWFIETGETHSWGLPTDIPLALPYAVRRSYFA